MFMMVERSVVLVTSDNSTGEKSANTIRTHDQEVPARVVNTRPVSAQQPIQRSETARMIHHYDDDFQRILAQWRKEYEDLYSTERTQEL